jgi:hypothetical protein
VLQGDDFRVSGYLVLGGIGLQQPELVMLSDFLELSQRPGLSVPSWSQVSVVSRLLPPWLFAAPWPSIVPMVSALFSLLVAPLWNSLTTF